jgi:MerR family redox-sensitive transcriptional activator SoxR
MFSIGEVAQATGINQSALRYYEQIGLIPSTVRKSGKRFYTNEVIGRVEVIKLAQNAGFQIPEIKLLLEGFDSNVPPSERWKVMAVRKHEVLEEKIMKLRVMQDILHNSLKCNCLSWDECFINIQIPRGK